jgi:hypothetical protein
MSVPTKKPTMTKSTHSPTITAVALPPRFPPMVAANKTNATVICDEQRCALIGSDQRLHVLRRVSDDDNSDEEEPIVQQVQTTTSSYSILCFVLLVVASVVYEGLKLHSCFLEKRDAVRNDARFASEAFCTDSTYIKQYPDRLAPECLKAQRVVDRGVVSAVLECFIDKHVVVQFFSFENTYVNLVFILLILYSLSLIKEYWVQTSMLRTFANTALAASKKK